MGSFSVGGLATGLDTKSIVDQLMALEGRPKAKLEWNQQLWSARKAAWGDLNTKLLSLQNSANALLNPSSWNSGLASGITTSDATLVDATGSPGIAKAGTYDVTVSQLARGEITESTGSLLATGVLADETLIVTQGSHTWNVQIFAGDQIGDIANRINATTGIGVTASVTGTVLQVASNSTGTPAAFSITSTGTTATELSFVERQSVLDAQYTVNGAAHTSATNTNATGGVPGVALTLKATTVTPVTITVTEPNQAWIDAAKQKVRDFVAQYNAVLDQVHQKTVTETKVTSPKNLTQYLQGPMAKDHRYAQVGFDLRMQAGEAVAGLAAGENRLADIGITAGFAIGGGASNGRLTIDEAKLEQALRTDASGVHDIIAQVGAGAGVTADDGLVRRISETVSALRVGGRVDASIQGASSQVSSLQDAIERAQDRVDRRRLYYERMFASLETVIGRMQSQSSWLSSQFSSLQG